MAALTCPRCRLISAPEAEACDCGYEFASGRTRLRREVRHLSQQERQVIAEAATGYRRLVVLALLQSLAGGASRVVFRLTRSESDPSAFGFAAVASLFLLIALCVVAAQAAYGVVELMEIGNPAAWAAGVLIGGIIALLALNGRVREWCRARGIGFGLLGPTKADIERLLSGRAG